MNDLLTIHARINDLAMGIVHDSRTFFWLLTEGNSTYEQGNKKYGIGGGNLLIALGLFSVIDLLSQYHWILNNGFTTKREINSEREKFNSDPAFKSAKKTIEASKIYRITPVSLNHTEAFVKMTEAIFPHWKLSRGQTEKIWDSFRNNLTHMAYPNGYVGSSYTPGQSFKQFEDEFSNDHNPFIIMGNGDITVMPQVLIKNIEKILSELKKEIETIDTSSEKAAELNSWLQENLTLWFEEPL